MNLRNLAWVLAMVVAAGACFAYGYICENFNTPSLWRVSLFPVIGIAALAMVFLTRPIQSVKSCVVFIWIPAVLLRLALLPTAPSDDVNRYLWEGKLVASGLSPYAHTADDESLRHLRDDYWQQMNHKDKPTAYPPLAELAFGAVSSVAYHPMGFKLLFIVADLLTLSGVLILLRQRGMALAYAGFYAFNPVVLISYAAEAHFDSLLVAVLVWALVAHSIGRGKWALVLASMATGVKWITLPMIPFFAVVRGDFIQNRSQNCKVLIDSPSELKESKALPLRLRSRRFIYSLLWVGAISITVLLLPALLFWETLPQLVQGLFQFGATRSFNGPIYQSLLWVGLPRLLCTLLVMGALGGILLWRWIQRDTAGLDAHIRWILGALIVLSPTVHLWYVAWILPFVCLRPSMPWLMFMLSGGAYYYVWINAAQGEWMLRPWQQLLFWAPFALACLYELWSTRGRVVVPYVRSTCAESASVAVIIPTLNVEGRIEQALQSVTVQSHAVAEVIVVDAGSTDRTVALVEDFDLPVHVMTSQRGRGQQIAAGIEAARADWIVVLHADAALNADSIQQVMRAVRHNPDIVGGALGQRFDDEHSELLPIELLNDLRALFTRTAFGDQTQFFHRETAIRYELMPKQPLMEDVESSWRVRECGGFLYLGQPTRVCHRKWQVADWFKRFSLVMRLMTRYRVARFQNRAAATALTENLYEEYYGSRK